jgi:hypothetical protein
MKKIIWIVLISIFIYSCQQSELQFSCDPAINEFVVDNQSALSQISIFELVTYELPLQRAIFTSWDAEKKRNVWIDKLNHLILNESFNKDEVDHIQKLINHIDVDYFLNEKTDKELELRLFFIREWLDYATNQLGWSDLYISFVVYRLYTEQSQMEDELSILESLGTAITTDSEGCNCNMENNFCSGFVDCISSGCTVTTKGCGWLLSESCDGSCNY